MTSYSRNEKEYQSGLQNGNLTSEYGEGLADTETIGEDFIQGARPVDSRMPEAQLEKESVTV
jgi:hypothetical protein